MPPTIDPPAADPPAVRFRDPRTGLYALAADEIQVVCPRCEGRAVSSARPGSPARAGTDSSAAPAISTTPRRLTCGGCGHHADWEPGPGTGTVWGAPVDPHFQLPLWLRTTCCGGHTLWAFHAGHLDLLAGHVGARLRERGPASPSTSLLERLPPWLTAARNRAEVLRAITRLRATLPG